MLMIITLNFWDHAAYEAQVSHLPQTSARAGIKSWGEMNILGEDQSSEGVVLQSLPRAELDFRLRVTSYASGHLENVPFSQSRLYIKEHRNGGTLAPKTNVHLALDLFSCHQNKSQLIAVPITVIHTFVFLFQFLK